MTITPDQADQWAQRATDGPWHVCDDPDDPGGTFIYDDLGRMRIAVANPVSAYLEADLDLIAAAPDMRATIAAQTWEYGVEQDNVTCAHFEHGADPTRCRTIAWAPDEDTARSHAAMRFRADRHPRVVRRLVGAVEEVVE